jgi:hypothetical protein
MMVYPFGKKKKSTYMDRGLFLSLAALALFMARREKVAFKEHSITNLKLFYYYEPANEFTEVSVRDGGTYNGSAMGIQIRFKDDSEEGSAVRITYDSKRNGQSVTAGTWTRVLSPGESGNYYLEPMDYGGTSMGVDTVDFVVEVLPPQTGGVPQEGESYPTYRFAYRL